MSLKEEKTKLEKELVEKQKKLQNLLNAKQQIEQQIFNEDRIVFGINKQVELLNRLEKEYTEEEESEDVGEGREPERREDS